LISKISAPVGDTAKRPSPKKPVKNNKDDVALVQQMLCDNGKTVKITGKCDSTTISQIKAFQKSFASKQPVDGVVDPGKLTMSKLLGKYTSAQKKRDAIVYVEVMIKGKKQVVTEDVYKAMAKELVKRLKPVCECYRSGFNINDTIYKKYVSMQKMEKDYLKSVSTILVMSTMSVSLPNSSLLSKANASVGKLERAISSGKMPDIAKAFPAAEKDVNALTKAMMKFLKDFGNTAKFIGDSLDFTVGVGWTIVGAMAAPVYLPAATTVLGAVALAAGVGAATSAMQAGTTAVLEQTLGDGKPAIDSAQDFLIEVLTGAAMGAIGAKLDAKAVTGVANKVCGEVAKKLGTGYTTAAIEKMLVIYLKDGAGKAIAVAALGEVITMASKTMKTNGKAPTGDDLLISLSNIVLAGMGPTLIKKFTDYNAKITNYIAKDVTNALADVGIKALRADKDLGLEVRKQLVKEVNDTMMTSIVATAKEGAIFKATGGESITELLTKSKKTVTSDAKIKREVENLANVIYEEMLTSQQSF